MIARVYRCLLTTLAAALLIACAAPTGANGQGAGSPGGAPAGTVSSHGGGVTNYVSLVDALRATGAEVTPKGDVEQPFFTVSGQLIGVNGADVQVFEYGSAAAAQADAEKVAPDGGSVGATMVTWVEPPHFYRTGSLIVLYVGGDATVQQTLGAVLGPQFAGR